MNSRNLIVASAIALVLLLGVFSCAGPSPVSGPPTTPATPSASKPAPAGLTLSVSEPADEITVNQNTLRIAGRTEPDAILSVNGNIITGIDQNGDFATALSLSEGPNVIELIASKYGENQVSKTLTVIYIP